MATMSILLLPLHPTRKGVLEGERGPERVTQVHGPDSSLAKANPLHAPPPPPPGSAGAPGPNWCVTEVDPQTQYKRVCSAAVHSSKPPHSSHTSGRDVLDLRVFSRMCQAHSELEPGAHCLNMQGSSSPTHFPTSAP